MSELKRFDLNFTPHVNGHYCNAQEAADLIEQQDAEIEALKAHVERLRDALEPFSVGGIADCISREDYSVMRERVKDWLGVKEFKKARELFNGTPQQNLAERDAEVARKAILTPLEQPDYVVARLPDSVWVSSADIERFANEYAERVKLSVQSSTLNR